MVEPRSRTRPPRALLLAGLAVMVAVAAGLVLGSDSGPARLAPSEVRAMLERYQAALTSGDIRRLEPLLAPEFRRQILAGRSVGRGEALVQYRTLFRLHGSRRRYSLAGVRVDTGSGIASATGIYSYTGGREPHLGDYGSAEFQLGEHDGRLLLDRVESYPDVIAFLPGGIQPSDYPITVGLTATTRAGGRRVTIAAARTRLAHQTAAVKVPLNSTGRELLKPAQRFRAVTTVALANGRRLPRQSYVRRFSR